MNARTLKGASSLVMVGSALAFIVVLFFDWHRTTVDLAGVTHVEADSAGWGGWGLLAGIAAIVLVALNLYRVRRGLEPDGTFGIADLVLGVVMLCATVAAVFSGNADVQVAVVGIESGTILWAAWLGLALSIVTAVAAALEALSEAWQPGRRATPTPA